jgi:peptidyl-prolyl cis-trans isomerase SurA
MNIRTKRFVNKLKKEHGFTAYPEALEPVYKAVDSTLLAGQWKGGGLKDSEVPLMKIGEHIIRTGEFVNYLERKQNLGKAMNPEAYVDMLYDEFTTDMVMDYEESRLPEKYPEFRYIYEEYHDGILLFDIMDQKVWTRAVADSSGLEDYYREHRKEYMWGERTEAYLVTCTRDADLAGLRSAWKKIAKGKWNEEKLNERYCPNDTASCITLSHLLVEEGANEMVDAQNGERGPGPVVEDGDQRSFVIVQGLRSPQVKKLEEARGQVTSDYQEYLESEWIRSLKEKYPVSVDRSQLNKITPGG